VKYLLTPSPESATKVAALVAQRTSLHSSPKVAASVVNEALARGLSQMLREALDREGVDLGQVEVVDVDAPREGT
jgi:hypothetical protein